MNIQVIMKKNNIAGTCLIAVITAALTIISYSCNFHNSNNPVVAKSTPDSIITEVCDSITRLWSTAGKQVNIKNINLKDSIRIDFFWDTKSGKWINYQKVVYVYDNLGNETSQTYYSFDININQWVFSSKSEVSYNEKGNKIVDTYYIWQASSGQWVASVKTGFSYDINGNDTLETLCIWKANLNKWIVSYKVENSYNAKGNKVLRVDYKLMQEPDIREFICKYEYTYNSDNNPKHVKYYYWNPKSKVWVNNSVSDYDYNNDLISHFYHHQWLYSSKSWFLDTKSTYYYKK